MKLDDAERAVAIARDGLRATLGLKIDGNWSSSKPSGGAKTDSNRLSAMLSSDLPWERTRERNVYRAALLALDAGRRALEAEEDATLDEPPPEVEDTTELNTDTEPRIEAGQILTGAQLKQNGVQVRFPDKVSSVNIKLDKVQ